MVYDRLLPYLLSNPNLNSHFLMNMDADDIYVVVVEDGERVNDHSELKLTVIDVTNDKQPTDDYHSATRFNFNCTNHTTFNTICDLIVDCLRGRQKKDNMRDLCTEMEKPLDDISYNMLHSFQKQNSMELEEFVDEDIQNVFIDRGTSVPPLSTEQDDNLFELFKSTLLKNERRDPEPVDSTCYSHIEGLFMCTFCNHSTSNEKDAIRHYRFRHGPRNHYCLACNATYRRHDYLLKHESFCGVRNADVLRKARKSIGSRSTIRLKHSKTLRSLCPLCGKLICQRNMKTHLKVHSSEPHYVCTECPARFRTSQALMAHGYAHRGLRPYRCDQCPKAYTSDTALYNHKLEHRSETFACDFCGRRFFRKYNLKLHMTAHTGRTPYLCQECGKSFNSRSSFQQHCRRHEGLDRRYKCTDCDKSFVKLSGLKKHLNKIHGLDIITRRMFFNSLPKMLDSVLGQ